MKDWKERVIRAVDMARVILQQEGRLCPTAFIFGDDNRILSPPWDTDEEKEMATASFRDEAKRLNATLFFFIEECWATEPETGREARVVNVYVQSSDSSEWSGLAFITEEKGVPTFGALDFAPMKERAVGPNRFCDLLSSKPKIHAIDDKAIQALAEELYQISFREGEAWMLEVGVFPDSTTRSLQRQLSGRVLRMVKQHRSFLERILRPDITLDLVEKTVNVMVEKVRAAVLEIARKRGPRR